MKEDLTENVTFAQTPKGDGEQVTSISSRKALQTEGPETAKPSEETVSSTFKESEGRCGWRRVIQRESSQVSLEKYRGVRQYAGPCKSFKGFVYYLKWAANMLGGFDQRSGMMS